MEIEYLVTTLNKSPLEIDEMLKKMNIKGNILVGNQNCLEESSYEINADGFLAKIFNLKNKGVSRNRNFLLKHARAEFVIFMDDDVSFINNNNQIKAERYVEQKRELDGIRFNLSSKGGTRTIKSINKDGFVKFNDVRSFGVWGIFFRRQFLIDNNLFFKEFCGPGSLLSHGEDTLFLYDYFKFGKIYQINECVLLNDFTKSTWLGSERNYSLEFFSDGFNYFYFYKLFAEPFFVYHLLKHKKEYFNSAMSIKKKIMWFRKGIKFYKMLKKKNAAEAFAICYGK